MIQLLHLSDTELDVVARFMGHDIRVHREYYRLPERTVYAAKVSKLLAAVSKGGAYAGKTLDELDSSAIGDVGGNLGLSAEGELGDSSAIEDLEGDLDQSTGGDRSPDGDLVVQSGTASAAQEREASGKHPEEDCPTQRLGPAPKRSRMTPWTKPEMAAIERQLSKYIADLKCPGMADCKAALRVEPALSRR